MSSQAGAYGLARRRGREQLRAALLDTASRLLGAEGAGALTMRRIAADAGCSTTVLYTMFGGKDGLAEALYLEGFERFRRRLSAMAPGPDPVEHLHRLAWTYRDNALAEPNYYRLMFAQAIPGFTPGDEALAAGNANFTVLVDATRACIESGVFVSGDPAEMAEVLWAAVHGVVSLELAGHFSGDVARQRYDTAVRAATSWFLAGVRPGR